MQSLEEYLAERGITKAEYHQEGFAGKTIICAKTGLVIDHDDVERIDAGNYYLAEDEQDIKQSKVVHNKVDRLSEHRDATRKEALDYETVVLEAIQDIADCMSDTQLEEECINFIQVQGLEYHPCWDEVVEGKHKYSSKLEAFFYNLIAQAPNERKKIKYEHGLKKVQRGVVNAKRVEELESQLVIQHDKVTDLLSLIKALEEELLVRIEALEKANG